MQKTIATVALTLIALTAIAATYTTAVTYVKTAPGDSVDVFLQDQTTPPVEYYLYRELDSFTIAQAAASRTNTLELVAGHAVTPGDFLNIYQEDTDFEGTGTTRKSFIQPEVISVATNTIRLDRFIGFDLDPAYVVSSDRVEVDIVSVGTLDNPIKYELCVPDNLIWDLTRIMPSMILGGAPDDGLFGSLPALTNGIAYGFESDAFDSYLINTKTNSDFRATAFDVSYTARSGGQGSWGMNVRKSFAGPDKYGVAIRLAGETSDCFVLYVQDDLTGINQFRAKIMGHFTEGEDTGLP